MDTIRLTGQIDEQGRLIAQVPPTLSPGCVEIDVYLPTTSDESATDWARGVAREWADELADERQEIYSLNDGRPVDEPR